MLRTLVRRARRRYWRWKLWRAYGTIAKVETGKTVGFTPTMHIWSLMAGDGWIRLEDGEVIWERSVLDGEGK